MVHIRRWSRAGMIVLLLLGLTACQRSEAGVPAPTLAGTSWELVRYGTPLSQTVPLSSTRPTFTFDRSGRVGGSSGCNSFSGKYAVTGTQLIITELGMTAMACMDNGVMDQEAYILQNLPTDATWTIVTDTLTLSDATHTFRFIRRRDQ